MWGRRAEVSWGRYAGGQSPRTQDTQLSRCGMGGPRRQPLRHWLEVGGVGPPMQPPVSAQLSHPPHNDSRGFLRGQLSMAAGKVPDRFHLCRGWTQQSAAEGVCACVRAHPCTGHGLPSPLAAATLGTCADPEGAQAPAPERKGPGCLLGNLPPQSPAVSCGMFRAGPPPSSSPHTHPAPTGLSHQSARI